MGSILLYDKIGIISCHLIKSSLEWSDADLFLHLMGNEKSQNL